MGPDHGRRLLERRSSGCARPGERTGSGRPAAADRTRAAAAGTCAPSRAGHAPDHARGSAARLHRPLRHLPSEAQESSHFVPVEDRWRIGFPEWDRYGKGHPLDRRLPVRRWATAATRTTRTCSRATTRSSASTRSSNITATSLTAARSRGRCRRPTTPFESTVRPVPGRVLRQAQPVLLHAVLLAVARPVPRRRGVQAGRLAHQADADLQHQLPRRRGAGRRQPRRAPGHRPRPRRSWPWRSGSSRRSSPTSAPTTTSSRSGPARSRSSATSAASSSATPTAASACSAPATANRDQFNLVYFDQSEKDTNSGLNTFDDRHQNIAHRQLLPPGLHLARLHGPGQLPLQPRPADASSSTRTTSWSGPTRSASFQPHELDVVYLGWAGDGHINRYQHHPRVLLGARPRHAQPARQPAAGHQRPDGRRRAVLRPRLGPLPHLVLLRLGRRRHRTTATPTGFDTILDNPNFAGGEFSYWQRQQIRLFGVNLVQREQPGARPAVEQDPGAEQLRQPGPVPGQPRRRLRPDAEAAG